jgi:hypothetical protein
MPRGIHAWIREREMLKHGIALLAALLAGAAHAQVTVKDA